MSVYSKIFFFIYSLFFSKKYLGGNLIDYCKLKLVVAFPVVQVLWYFMVRIAEGHCFDDSECCHSLHLRTSEDGSFSILFVFKVISSFSNY